MKLNSDKIKIWDIPGGIHPSENKTQSLQQPLTNAGIPKQLILPLSQHIGAAAKPTVSVGQAVLKGEVIAAAAGFVSAPLHAPTSGTISAIEDRAISHPSGLSGHCIVIDTDGKDQWQDHAGIANYAQQDASVLLEAIRQAGIAGMGGAGFPSAVKLQPKKPIETLIINGTECEPYITADDILMQSAASEILIGVHILQLLLKPKRTLIGIEDNKPEAIEKMRTALQQATVLGDTAVVEFPTKYPSGGEKQLIQILTGKHVPSGGLPADIGISCQNVGTIHAIQQAICLGEPLISRITTVTGNALKQAQNYRVLIGTPIDYLLDKSGFEQQQCSRLIIGGPMMGYAITDTSVPVVKTTNCLLAPSKAEIPPPASAQACIRCGLCAEACPASLLPQQLYWFSRGKEYEKLEKHNLFDCIECGACSYVCPSNIPLVQYYRSSKATVRKLHSDHEKAEQSKLRFEARNMRLEQEEKEKQQKRKARQEAAKRKANANNKDSKQDLVQAAIERAKAKKTQQTEGKSPLSTASTATKNTQEEPKSDSSAKQAPLNETTIEETDVAKLAIAKAMAKREQSANLSDKEKLEQQIASLEKRVKKSSALLNAAQDEGDSDKAEILASSVEKIQAKLNKAQESLAALETSDNA